MSKMLKTSDPAIANSVWSIEDIVDGPKYEVVNGKKKKLYKVRWSESYELASNIPAELIEIFEKHGQRTIKILGPVIDDKATLIEEPETNGKDQKAVNLMKTKFAVEKGDDVEILSYKQVKSLYKDELFDYFEERAKIDG